MRFIGCKKNLLHFIETFVKQKDIKGNVFCDLFSGTGSVAKHFKKLGYKIISSDLLFFSYVLQKTYIELNQYPKFTELLKYLEIDSYRETLFTNDSQNAKEIIRYLNNLEGVTGMRQYENLKSEFCNAKTGIKALGEIIKKNNFKYLLLSYNNDGIISENEILKLFHESGESEVIEQDYQRYKSNSGGKQKRGVKEKIYYLKNE